MTRFESQLEAFFCRHRTPTILLLLYSHVVIAGLGAFRNGPAWDEVGHLVAGLEHWDQGTFSLYKVNPPLPRMVATIPIAVSEHHALKIESQAPFFGRPEWTTGINFVESHGARVFDYFAWARISLIPFSVLGALVCLWWAEELFGATAGFCALTCWCFSPSILANAQLMTPDLAAAASGLLAAWTFRSWAKRPSWRSTAIAGLCLGLALICKMTWLLLFLLWPVVWVIVRQGFTEARTGVIREALQLTVAFLVAVYVVNLGYGFEGSFRKLGDYRFVSSPIRGEPFDEWETFPVGNVFRGSFLEKLPVPLPASFVEGIDFQKQEFVAGYWSYLLGEHRQSGWWNFYALAMLWKVPVGFWVLFCLGTLEWLRNLTRVEAAEGVLLAGPALIVLIVVSSQTGFCHHVRYVLPVLPFGAIWASRAIQTLGNGYNFRSAMTVFAFFWGVLSSACAYPNYLSYFNGFVGGTENAPYYMGMGPMDSTFEWGQDLLELSEWVRQSPFVGGLDGVAFGGLGQIRNAAGIPPSWPPVAGDPRKAKDVCQLGPRPGWYAVGIKDVFNESSDFHYFSRLRPFKRIGQTIFVYRVTEHDADVLWKKLYGDAFPRQHCWWRMNPRPLVQETEEVAPAKGEAQ